MKKYFFKCLSLIITVIILIPTFSIFLFAHNDDTFPSTSKADAVCLYSLNTDTVIYDKNMQKKIFPGSAVKMMTGLIACETLSERLEESVTITESMLTDSVGANIKLKSGMTVTIEDLLYGVLCGGGNDAALVLAEICSGSVESFVKAMNQKAREWGLGSTKFTNPTGLDDKAMYSSVGDVLVLAKRAQQNKLYMDVSSTISYTFNPLGTNDNIKFYNKNYLLSTHSTNEYKNIYASGMIAGNTDLGGHCVITFAERKNAQYICIVMGAQADESNVYSYKIANALLYHMFENYSYTRIVEQGTVICDVRVRFALPSSKEETKQISCIVKNDVYALIPNTVNTEKDLTYRYYLHNEVLNAPIEAGAIVGGVDILFNGEILANTVIVTKDNIEASQMLLFLNRLKNFFLGRAFWLTVIFFVIISTVYFYITELRFRHKTANKIKYKNFY